VRIVMAEYVAYYNGRRPTAAANCTRPVPTHLGADLSQERIRCRLVLGGLINEYERAA